MRIIYALIMIIIPTISSAQMKVFEQTGGIYYQKSDSTPIQLTHTDKDHSPILSPNGKIIAFIRETNIVIPKDCTDFSDSAYGKQIWIIDLAHQKERLLVKPDFTCHAPKTMIVNPIELQFSPDGNTLYFVTQAWVTSGAVHAVNLDGSQLRYVLPGSLLEIVKDGEYKGYLVVNQHRYFINGGSYDWFWLFTPNGKEVGPLGEDPEVDIMKKMH